MVKRRRVVLRDQPTALLEQTEETTPSTMLTFNQARLSLELKLLNQLFVLQVQQFYNLLNQRLLIQIKKDTLRVSNKSTSKKQMLAERLKMKMLAWSTILEEIQKTTDKKAQEMEMVKTSLGQWANNIFLIS